MIRIASAFLLCLTVSAIALLCTSKQQVTASQPAQKIITNSLGMKFAYIPAGSFLMGSPNGEKERSSEEMQHKVAITQSFYMGVYEVRQREFLQLLSAAKTRGGPIFTAKRGGGPDHPMENVRWKHAVEFCTLLSKRTAEKQAGRTYRLPTEAEWEYACRAGTTTPFYFGNSLSSVQANFNGTYPYGAKRGPNIRMTCKVGLYKPNAWGLYDMHGNVAEWCSDYYDPAYYRKSPSKNPTGPKKGVISTDYGDFYRVVRGGCWLDEARACRSAYRFRAMPHDPYRLIGFRVVCEVKQ